MESKLEHDTKAIKEKLRIAAILAINAGFIDAYTFFHYDNRFAGAQTGNLVQAGIAAAQGEWWRFGGFLLPIFFFGAGIMLRTAISHLRQTHHRGDTTYLIWLQLILLLLFVTIDVMDRKLPATVCISVLSFIMAIQMNNFSVTRGLAYGSIFSTANIRSFAQNVALYFLEKDQQKLSNASVYLTLVLAFFFGALLSTFIQPFFGIWTLYLSAFFLLAVLFIFARELKNLQRQLS